MGWPPFNCFSAIYLTTTLQKAQEENICENVYFSQDTVPQPWDAQLISKGSVFGTAPFMSPTAAGSLGSAHTKF